MIPCNHVAFVVFATAMKTAPEALLASSFPESMSAWQTAAIWHEPDLLHLNHLSQTFALSLRRKTYPLHAVMKLLVSHMQAAVAVANVLVGKSPDRGSR